MTNITITIPTFNRAELLIARIKELLPQLEAEDKLIIFDNATPGFLSKLKEIPEDPRITVYVNKANIGGNANIAQCLYHAKTGWLWIASDDDTISPLAVSTIKKVAAENGNACFINFKSSATQIERTKEIKAVGLDEFIDNNDGFQWTLLISSCVFNLDVINVHMEKCYLAIPMNCPHIAPVVTCLQDGGQMVYSPGELVSWSAPNLKKSWSVIGLYHLLELPRMVNDKFTAKKLSQLIIRSLPSKYFFIINLCYSLASYGKDWRAVPYARFVVAEMSGRFKVIDLILNAVLLVFVRFPCFGVFMFSMLYRVFGKNIENTVQNKPFKYFL